MPSMKFFNPARHITGEKQRGRALRSSLRQKFNDTFDLFAGNDTYFFMEQEEGGRKETKNSHLGLLHLVSGPALLLAKGGSAFFFWKDRKQGELIAISLAFTEKTFSPWFANLPTPLKVITGVIGGICSVVAAALFVAVYFGLFTPLAIAAVAIWAAFELIRLTVSFALTAVLSPFICFAHGISKYCERNREEEIKNLELDITDEKTQQVQKQKLGTYLAGHHIKIKDINIASVVECSTNKESLESGTDTDNPKGLQVSLTFDNDGEISSAASLTFFKDAPNAEDVRKGLHALVDLNVDGAATRPAPWMKLLGSL